MRLKELEDKGLTPETESILKEKYGERGKKALRAVKQKRVKEYLDFTVVVGNREEYIADIEDRIINNENENNLEEGICNCPDFYYNLEEGEWCWHLLAVKIADILDETDFHNMWYSEVGEII